MIKRIPAAIVGALILFFCATFTLGTVLAAPIGVLVARWMARRRSRPLTRGAAWLGAVLASFIAVPLIFGGLLAVAPPGTLASIRAGMDSAQAQPNSAELPPWLQKISPPQTPGQRAATEQLTTSKPFLIVFGTIGILMACSILGTIAGSIGWVASMLLAYAIGGRWLPSGATPPGVPLPEE